VAATASWNFSRASEYERLKLSAPIINFSQSFHSFRSRPCPVVYNENRTIEKIARPNLTAQQFTDTGG
jgi:hypothetical protein